MIDEKKDAIQQNNNDNREEHSDEEESASKSEIYVEYLKHHLRGQQIEDGEEKVYLQEDEMFKTLSSSSKLQTEDQQLSMQILEQLNNLDVQREFFNELPVQELMDYVKNYQEIDWQELKLMKRDASSNQEEVQKLLEVPNDLLGSGEQLSLVEYEHHQDETLQKIMDLLFIPLSSDGNVKVMVDMGPKRMRAKLKFILQQLYSTLGLVIYEKIVEQQVDSDDEEEMEENPDKPRYRKKSSSSEHTDHDDVKLTSSEWVLLEVTRNKLQRAQREISRHKIETEYIRDQLSRSNKALKDVTHEYSIEFSSLKTTLLQQLQNNSFHKKNNSKELMLLSTFGSSLINDLSTMLEEERKGAAKIVFKLKDKFEKEKAKMERDFTEVLKVWKARLVDTLHVKTTVEEELNELKQQLGREKTVIQVPTISTEEIDQLIKDRNEEKEQMRMKDEEELNEILNSNVEMDVDNMAVDDSQPSDEVDRPKKRVSFAAHNASAESGDDPTVVNEYVIVKDPNAAEEIHTLKKQLMLSYSQNKELKKYIQAKTTQFSDMEVSYKRLQKKNTKLSYNTENLKDALNEAKIIISNLKEENRSLSLQLRRIEHVEKKDDAVKPNSLNTKEVAHHKRLDSHRSENSTHRSALSTYRSDNLDPFEKEARADAKLKRNNRIKALESEVTDLKDKITDWTEIVNDIDVDSFNKLQIAVKEAEHFEKGYYRKLEKWETYIHSKSDILGSLSEMKSKEMERNVATHQQQQRHKTPDSISSRKSSRSSSRSLYSSKGKRMSALAAATERLVNMSSNESLEEQEQSIIDDAKETEDNGKSILTSQLIEQMDASQHSLSPSGGSKPGSPANPYVPFEINFQAVKNRNEEFNDTVTQLEGSDHLDDKDKKILNQIIIQKRNLEKEREKKWNKVLSIAQQFTRNSKLHPRLKQAVPLVITTISNYTKLANNLEKQAVEERDILKPKFATRKHKVDDLLWLTSIDDGTDPTRTPSRSPSRILPSVHRSVSAMEKRSTKLIKLPARSLTRLSQYGDSPTKLQHLKDPVPLRSNTILGSLKEHFEAQIRVTAPEDDEFSKLLQKMNESDISDNQQDSSISSSSDQSSSIVSPTLTSNKKPTKKLFKTTQNNPYTGEMFVINRIAGGGIL
jgi:hypothetical protein